MLIHVPHSPEYPVTMLIITINEQETRVSLDDSHWTYEFQLPEGGAEEQVEVYSIYLGGNNQPALGCGPCCLKRAVPAVESAPVVVEAPVVEMAPAVDAAPAVEPTPAKEPHDEASTETDAPAAVAADTTAAAHTTAKKRNLK